MIMNNEKKEIRKYLIMLLLIAIIGLNFVAVMGFLNYRTVAIELEEQLMGRTESDIVANMETAISFGKDIRNFYGIEEVFESFSKRYAGPQPYIISEDGELLYYAQTDSENSDREIKDFLRGIDISKAIASPSESGSFVVNSGYYRSVLYPIHQDENLVGYFCCIYNEGFFSESLRGVCKNILLGAQIFALAECLALYIFVRIVKNEEWKRKHQRKIDKNLERLCSVLILGLGILTLSASSIYYYQKDYRSRIENSVVAYLASVEEDISKVSEQGVDLRTVEGLDDYIRERILSLNFLQSVRITERISQVEKTNESSNVLSFEFVENGSDGGTTYLEAEVSENSITKEMRNIIMVLLSTMIILLIFVFELNNMVEIVDSKNSDGNDFSEKKVGILLRFTGFLCSTAEYMCVPYAAMLIRSNGEALFGMSVGMTAALPLTLEGVAQMIGMLVLPKYVKKFNTRNILVYSTVLMAICNIFAFASGRAAVIIMCRALAGIAYSGFKQVSNYLITRGYVTESGRSNNISQDNAGLLAGATCGAGLGAIFSVNLGYAMTFVISAVIFVVYCVVTVLFVPWKSLAAQKGETEEDKPVSIGSIAKMIKSPEIIFFILFIGIPLNIGVMLCVTLIPAICQTQGISSVILSYCYIANGLAGIYIGPALVTVAKERFGLQPCIAFSFAITAVSIFILHVPPVVLMIIITSMVLGFLDGFGTPMVTDRFMSLNIVRNSVDESTALIFSVVLSYVLLTFAPMIAELMLIPGKGLLSPMMIGAIAYAVAAVILILFKEKNK